MYSKGDWIHPDLDNLEFSILVLRCPTRLLFFFFLTRKRKLQNLSLTDLSGDRALGPDGFTISFVQNFWEEVKVEVMCFMTELGVLKNTKSVARDCC